MPFGDIKLEEQKVTISGYWLYAKCWDLHLDHPDRRISSTHSSPHRRALVHDFQDGLTINYNQDYPGGITLRGKVKVTEEINVLGKANFQEKPRVPDILLTSLPVFSVSGGGFSFDPPISSVPGIPGLPGRTGSRGGSRRPIEVSSEPASLVAVIRKLQQKINALEERIATLESA